MTRLLVTVAHPDDETFATGSVIAAAAHSGYEVTVCCATRGEAGEAHGLATGADLAAVREAELRAAGNVLGVRRVVLFGYGDSGMDGPPAVGTLTAAPTAELAERVSAVVAEVQPEVVITLDPVAGDGHRDHTAIARATLEACRAFPALRAYAWAIPRALLSRWFAEIEKVRPESAHLDLDRRGLGRPETDITTILDVSHVRQTRERAIAQHASQTTPFDDMPTNLRDAFLNTDYLVRLQPPWGGSEVERALFGDE